MKEEVRKRRRVVPPGDKKDEGDDGGGGSGSGDDKEGGRGIGTGLESEIGVTRKRSAGSMAPTSVRRSDASLLKWTTKEHPQQTTSAGDSKGGAASWTAPLSSVTTGL